MVSWKSCLFEIKKITTASGSTLITEVPSHFFSFMVIFFLLLSTAVQKATLRAKMVQVSNCATGKHRK